MDNLRVSAGFSAVSWLLILVSLGLRYLLLACGGFIITWLILASLAEIEEAIKK